MKSSLVSTVLVLAVLGAPAANAAPAAKPAPAAKATAGAKPAAGDRKAAAAALFQQGIQALEAGKTAEACEKLTESVATLPDSGAMGALAECDTALGRLAEAWELWRQLSTSAPTAELREDAAKNAAALDLRLARVTLHLRGPVPSDLAVTLNDKLVRTDEATEHRVSPGALLVVAASPEIERWTRTVDAKPGAKLDVEVQLVASRSASTGRRRGRIAGLSIAAVGAVGLAIGAVAGGAASADWNSASTSCGGDTDHCKSSGYETAQSQLASARRSARLSSWSTGIGLGAVAVGVIMYIAFRDPKAAEPTTAWRAAPIADSQVVGLSLTRSLP